MIDELLAAMQNELLNDFCSMLLVFYLGGVARAAFDDWTKRPKKRRKKNP